MVDAIDRRAVDLDQRGEKVKNSGFGLSRRTHVDKRRRARRERERSETTGWETRVADKVVNINFHFLKERASARERETRNNISVQISHIFIS